MDLPFGRRNGVFCCGHRHTLESVERGQRERERQSGQGQNRARAQSPNCLFSSRVPEVMLLDVSARGESALHFCLDEGVALVPEVLSLARFDNAVNGVGFLTRMAPFVCFVACVDEDCV